MFRINLSINMFGSERKSYDIFSKLECLFKKADCIMNSERIF